MYYICGLSYSEGRLSIECFLCEPIYNFAEAVERFEKSAKYTDGLISGLFDTSKGKWLGVILNYKPNTELCSTLNSKNFGPKHFSYPIANVDV